ncbi:MAG: AarF/ABC1/UbiB kinase family protein [Vicinamibacterales bacterium]
MSLGATARRSFELGRLGVDVLRAQRQDDGPGRDAARRMVALRMGRMRGLPQKIGQILSLGELDTGTSLFSELTDAAEPAPAAESFAWIARELGAPIERVFRHLDQRGAAASLGQVHRGELHDARAVAVKVQFPGVRESLDTDLSALGWLAAPLSARRSGFDLEEYRAEMRRSLLRELDYDLEAATLRRFAARADQVPGLVTPIPIDQFCTPRLITMSWVPGDRLQATTNWPDTARHEAALVLLRLFLRGSFVWREVHADPHAGNIRFARQHDGVRVGVIDFGCVKTLSAAESDALRRLAQDGPDMTGNELFDTYVELGFDPRLLAPMAGRLHAVTAVLFEPFHARGPFDSRHWDVSARLAEALGDDRWNFRFAGPASLLFLIRAFQGLVQYLRAFEATIDWRRELLAIPRHLDSGHPQPRADRAAARASAGDSMEMLASNLRLQVERNGETVVRLAFPASAAAHLPDLVPVDLGERLHARGISLAQLAESTVAAGYPPGDLFRLDDGASKVRVWLD